MLCFGCPKMSFMVIFFLLTFFIFWKDLFNIEFKSPGIDFLHDSTITTHTLHGFEDISREIWKQFMC